MDKRGTGDTLLTIDLGDIGSFEISDDGFTDTDIRYDSIPNAIKVARETYSDEWIFEQLADAEIIPGERTSSSYDIPGPFICTDCHRTWPSHANETPNADVDTCPDCF